jgi:hypothetical protein
MMPTPTGLKNTSKPMLLPASCGTSSSRYERSKKTVIHQLL